MDSKIFERTDGLARVTITALPDGRFTFSEDARRHAENPIGDPYDYWLPVLEGGLYASFEEAEAAARATISWLRSSEVW